MADLYKQSQTAHGLQFKMVSSADHLTPITGLAGSVVVTISKNGGAFSTPLGVISEIGSGWYQVAGNATDEGTLGPLVLRATATGCDLTEWTYQVVGYDPDLDIASSAAVATAVLDGVVSAPTAVPSAPYTLRSMLGWVFALAKFKRTQTASTETVFGEDGVTAIATSGKADSGGSFSRGEYS
jgi:hypothetical protein